MGFLELINHPKLSSDQLTSLNAPFSITKVSQAISSFSKGKAPGPDGMSAEYYKLFNNTLAPYLCQLFSAAASYGEFANEMLSANIVTLPKNVKELTTPSNFCLISLLNTDLKLYASPETNPHYTPPHIPLIRSRSP